MRRRDIAKALMLSAAPALLSREARAQACTAPCYARTHAEAVAGVTTVNTEYPPLNVLRYGAAGDGTSDDSTAINQALTVAKVAGGTVYFPRPTAFYLLLSSLNCTLPQNVGSNTLTAGFNVKMDGNPHFSTASPQGTLHARHTGHVFDCTGNNAIQFYDLCVTSDAGTTPQTCFLCARNSTGSSLVQRFNNCRVYGSFSVAVYYAYGSEDDQIVGCFFANFSRGAQTFAGSQAPKVCVWSTNNVAGLTSPYIKIASGPQSTLHHQVVGGDFLYGGQRSTGDVFYLEQCGFVSILNAWAAAASGRAIVFGDSSHAPACSYTTVLGLEVENGEAPAYGILCPDPASGSPTIISFNVRDSYFAGVDTQVINFGSRVNLSRAHLHGLTTKGPGNGGISIPGTLSNSFIACDAMPLTIGISLQNNLIGSVQSWKIGSHSGDSWTDCRPAASRTWHPDVSALGVGIVVSDTYSCVAGNVVDVVFSMRGGSLGCAAGTLVTGLPFTPAFAGGFVNVFDNLTSMSLGQGGVTARGLAMPAISATARLLTVSARYFLG